METRLIKCPTCGRAVSSNATACPSCGQPIDTSIKCPKCGSTDTKIISGGSKAASLFLVGVFAMNKVMSKYVCIRCGHKF